MPNWIFGDSSLITQLPAPSSARRAPFDDARKASAMAIRIGRPSISRQLVLPLGVLVAMTCSGCSDNSSNAIGNAARSNDLDPPLAGPEVQMPPSPPLPLERVEAAVEQACPINVKEWRRVYSYRWIPRFAPDFITFSFDKGPYADLRPSRSWRDIRTAVGIDDRPGISVMVGHYHIGTGRIDFELGPCSERL